MKVLAVIALIRRRRWVAAESRRARVWGAAQLADLPEQSRRGRAMRLGSRAVGRAWQAVDTQPNAARVGRLVRWLRALSAPGASAADSIVPCGRGAVSHG